MMPWAIASCCLLAFLAQSAHVAGSSPARNPHIVYFLVDDLGFASVGFNSPTGEPKTPTIDGLREEGAVLSRFYTFRVCSPTRSSFLSGRLPLHVNQVNHPPNEPGGGVPANMTTIAEVLKRGGYATHHIGKWHGGMSQRQKLPVNRGFDSSLAMLSGAEDHFEQTRLGFVDLWRDHAPAHGENGTYSAFLFTEEATRVIEKHDPSTPMFMFLAYELTHEPLQAPQRFIDLYPESIFSARRLGLAMISAVDEGIANVTAALKARGMYENSLIIFSSDNGGPADHEPNYPLRGHKANELEGGVRVVAFVSGGFLPEGRRNGKIDGFMHIVDWYATFARLAGVDPQDCRAAAAGLPPVDSLDMLDMIMGTNSSSPRTEVPLSGGPSQKKRGFIWLGGSEKLRGPWKLIRGSQNEAYFPGPTTPNGTASAPAFLDCTPACLFDLGSDEVEHYDVASKYPWLLKKLLERAEALDKTYFQSAGESKGDPAAKKAAKEQYGGFWGPWQPDEPIAECMGPVSGPWQV